MIPSVVASERGTAQTTGMSKAISVVPVGLRDMIGERYGAPGKLQSCHLVEPVWISQAIEGDSPVDER